MPIEFPRFPKHNLFEVTGQFKIGPEAIDTNEHVNNAYYLTIYEGQRALYIATCIRPLAELGRDYNIRSFVVDSSIRYERQLVLDDEVTIHTAAQDQGSHLDFYQRMTKEDKRVNYLMCTVYAVGPNGRALRRLPEEILDKVNQANSQNTSS